MLPVASLCKLLTALELQHHSTKEQKKNKPIVQTTKMSSVNFNIGFSTDRNSSRVLKPPGGGHTDIFNVKDVDVVEQKKRVVVEQSSSSTIKETLIVENKSETSETVENVENNGKESEVENEKPKQEQEIKAAEPVKRTRVPPGGFSSGLW